MASGTTVERTSPRCSDAKVRARSRPLPASGGAGVFSRRGGPRRSLQWPSVISRSPSLSLLGGDHIGGYVRCTTLACRRLLHRLAQLDPDAVDVALDVRHAELAPHRRKQVGINGVLRARVDGRAGPPLAAARLKRLGGGCLGQCLGGCLSARVARPLRRLPPPPGGLLLLLLLPCARRAAVAVVLRAASWVAQQVVRL